jgi:hypothetical protein
MTYQVRITDSDGSNPIVLEQADDISYAKAASSSDESISFSIPTADGKTSLIDYTKLWEFWDVAANKRLNRGPIHTIDTSDPTTVQVDGPGRSQFLEDDVKENLLTFNMPLAYLVDTLRFENIATEPGTNTYTWDGKDTTYDIFYPSGVVIDQELYAQYHGLSKSTSINAVDGDNGDFAVGTNKPYTTYHSSTSYWSGVDVADSLIIDLGDVFTISKNYIEFPGWGGIERLQNRSYDFEFAYTDYNGSIEALDPNDWNTIYETTLAAQTGPYTFFYMPSANLTTYDSLGGKYGTVEVLSETPIQARYFRIAILDTHAWYNGLFNDEAPVDKYGHQCDPASTDDDSGSPTGTAYPVMRDKKISDRTLEPQNDCHASVLEFGAYVELIERNSISGLVNQRIKSDNKGIKYRWSPADSFTIDTGTYRKFEPGGFFTEAQIVYSGASTSYTKFFDADCATCYNTFKFGVMDQRNSLIYRSTTTADTVTIECPSYTSVILMKGSSDAVITDINGWQAKQDALSWGGLYSFIDATDDEGVASLIFRGRSFKWWATVPAGATPGDVTINLRSKDEVTGLWNSYTELEANFILPVDISSELIYEIPYGSPLLEDSTTYEIRINWNAGYVSIDSFGGWWEGSTIEENEDSERVFVGIPAETKQIYDARFSNGTISKTNAHEGRWGFDFIGDKFQIFSAKGENYGIISLLIFNQTGVVQYDPVDTKKVWILEGDVIDGSYSVDLDVASKENEIPQALIFDSDNFTYKFGEAGDTMDSLPWGRYFVALLNHKYWDTYFINPTVEDPDQLPQRCRTCSTPPAGTREIGKYTYFDGFTAHNQAGISAQWQMQTNLAILKSLAETLEFEWDIGEEGLTTAPRIGIDTDIILKEGIQTVISTSIVEDASNVSTMLLSSGSDIDGLPLSTITEDRRNRQIMGRTIKRIKDFRSIADYFTLIGVSRGELKRRREPEERYSITHVGYQYGLNPGDTFIVKKNTKAAQRVRINQLVITQSKDNGITYNLECIKWPQVV